MANTVQLLRVVVGVMGVMGMAVLAGAEQARPVGSAEPTLVQAVLVGATGSLVRPEATSPFTPV
jgi:hypothetical protein